MKVALLGFDVEGRASYEFFKARGADITICDQNADLEAPGGVETQLGPEYLDGLDRFDLLVRTPGLRPSDILAKNPGIEDKITSATNLFYENSPTKNLIGVTGTKGKGTTSTLIAKILEAAGKKVFLGGNIGVPALSFLNEIQPGDWVVIETSSFQSTDIKYSPHIGVCLMVVPEHLNWHRDFDDYVNAKRQLFIHQAPDDLMIYNADNATSRDIAHTSRARKLWYSTQLEAIDTSIADPMHRGAYEKDGHIYMDEAEICSVDEIALLGAHNWQNVCAAVAATWEVIGGDRDAVRRVVTTFRGLEHRLELVRSLDGVAYYDDSFGTTPETAIVAIQAFQEPKIVILGGSDKGTEFDELARTVKESGVKHALLIGDTAPKIEAALKAADFTDYSPGGGSMPEIVKKAHELAESGDVVLLSTGCASFGMFQNYKDRGNQFQQSVNALYD
jgi:UDP-N-acetylmuramoylalanine--D-glutamate ligase